jgi:hypothetical protein
VFVNVGCPKEVNAVLDPNGLRRGLAVAVRDIPRSSVAFASSFHARR